MPQQISRSRVVGYANVRYPLEGQKLVACGRSDIVQALLGAVRIVSAGVLGVAHCP